MTSFNPILLRKAARHFGVQPSYYSNTGEIVWSPEATLIRMLEGLNTTKIQSNEDLLALIKKKSQLQWERGIEPCLVFWGGKGRKFHLYLPGALKPEQIRATVSLENKETMAVEIKIHLTRQCPLGTKILASISADLPQGYHHLHIETAGLKLQSFLICPPDSLTSLLEKEKSWGPFVPLYALKTQSDLGMGSLHELQKASKIFKKYGAKWIGSLPLLAGRFDDSDCDPSPYSALTRLFWNDIYLDLPALLEESKNQTAKNLFTSAEFIAECDKLRAKEFADYFTVYNLKKKVIRLLADDFFAENGHQHNSDFLKYHEQNPEIFEFAKFRAKEVCRAESGTLFESEFRYHVFAQFKMDQQLAKIKNELPLYMDFPVGVNDSGFDFKMFPDVFFNSVSVGAPPEPVFALGQDWGFPAFHPVNMRSDQYKYFRKALAVHLRHAKLLRLDHVMGLFRIYSVPKGMKGAEGAYLRFPEEELFAVCILEAQKAGSDFIGENLGTVPEKVTQLMQRRNIKGMWVFEMEAGKDPQKVLSSIPKETLACANTHDMPMLSCFFSGDDLDQVAELGILDKKFLADFKAERHQIKHNWQLYLQTEEKLNNKIFEAINKSTARYLVVNLEDLWQETAPQNIPGTWKEYPNWRKKFKIDLETFEGLRVVQSTLPLLKAERGSV